MIKNPQQWRQELGLDELEQKHNLPHGLLTAVLTQESAGDSNAGSKAGAKGLFQFMPDTANMYHIDPLDPKQAADGAARMYADLSNQHGGDLNKMLAGYNWGSGNLANKGMANAPEETRNYIKKIRGYMAMNDSSEGKYAEAEQAASGTDSASLNNFSKVNAGKKGKKRNPEQDEEDQSSFISNMMQENPVLGLFLLVIGMMTGLIDSEKSENLFNTFNKLPEDQKEKAIESLSPENRRNLETYQQAFKQAANAPIAEGAIAAEDGSPPKAFIMHHTGGRGTAQGVVATLKARGLGVQYVMDRDGKIYQTGVAGESHIRPGEGKLGSGLNNSNVVGMEIIAKDDADITPKQVEAAKEFIRKYYPNTPVIGHGEINSHKQETEGTTVAQAIRAERNSMGINTDVTALSASLMESGMGNHDHHHNHAEKSEGYPPKIAAAASLAANGAKGVGVTASNEEKTKDTHNEKTAMAGFKKSVVSIKPEDADLTASLFPNLTAAGQFKGSQPVGLG